jgi:hypothetical protein
VLSKEDGSKTTHEDEGCVQVLVVFVRIVPVKFSRFPPVHSEKVSLGIVGPQRLEELFEGGMEAVLGY